MGKSRFNSRPAQILNYIGRSDIGRSEACFLLMNPGYQRIIKAFFSNRFLELDT